MSLGAGERKKRVRGGSVLWTEASCSGAGFPLSMCESREAATLAVVWACCRGTTSTQWQEEEGMCVHEQLPGGTDVL